MIKKSESRDRRDGGRDGNKERDGGRDSNKERDGGRDSNKDRDASRENNKERDAPPKRTSRTPDSSAPSTKVETSSSYQYLLWQLSWINHQNTCDSVCMERLI